MKKILNYITEILQSEICLVIKIDENISTILGGSDGLTTLSDEVIKHLISTKNIDNIKIDSTSNLTFAFVEIYPIDGLDNHFLIVLSNKEINQIESLKNHLSFLAFSINSKEDDAGEEKLKSMNVREIVRNIDFVIYSVNESFNTFNFVGGALNKIFGISSRKEIKEEAFFLNNVEKKYHSGLNEFFSTLKNGVPSSIEYPINLNNGNTIQVRHSGTPIKDGQVVKSIFGMIEDITSDVVLRDKLSKAEEKFSMLVDTADDFIFQLDGQGNFLSANTNGILSLGYSSSEILGKHFLEIVSDDNKAEVAIAFQKILKENDVTRFEAQLNDNLDRPMLFDIQARPIKNDGKITGMLGIGRDITKMKKGERELKNLNNKFIEANRIISIERDRAKEKVTVLEELNKLKNDFISTVSHELRTPLASIVGFAEAISSDPEMPREMINEFNGIIYSEGKRLAKLINDILDFSKFDSGEEPIEKTDVDVMEILRDLQKTYLQMAEQKEILLSSEIPEASAIISCDHERIKNAIGQVVHNAIKFTEKGGRVTILVNNFLKDIEIIISDTGIGIPEKELPKLFQKFTKVNRAGTQIPGAGIGLASAKKIIDLHNGLIIAKSEVNKGTSFIIRLPKKTITN